MKILLNTVAGSARVLFNLSVPFSKTRSHVMTALFALKICPMHKQSFAQYFSRTHQSGWQWCNSESQCYITLALGSYDLVQCCLSKCQNLVFRPTKQMLRNHQQKNCICVRLIMLSNMVSELGMAMRMREMPIFGYIFCEYCPYAPICADAYQKILAHGHP